LAVGEIEASFENALAFMRLAVDNCKDNQRQQDIQGANTVMDHAEDGADLRAEVDEAAEALCARQLASAVNPYAASRIGSPTALMLTSGSPSGSTPSGANLLANTCDYLRMLANTCECLRILENTCEYLRILANTCEYLRILANTCEYLRILANTCEYLRIY
jgi:hypothetical protein